jgi:hypothetical protein
MNANLPGTSGASMKNQPPENVVQPSDEHLLCPPNRRRNCFA